MFLSLLCHVHICYDFIEQKNVKKIWKGLVKIFDGIKNAISQV